VRVAVVTPCYQTPAPWLAQCLESVARQSAPCTHFLVLDGDAAAPIDLPAEVQVARLPGPHRDTGNAARAVGSVLAISQGFDAVAYLDADNWYEPDHVRLLCAAHADTGAAVCSAGRTLFDLDGNLLGPCPEVDGERFVDTNCLFLTRAAFGIVAAWYLVPRPQAEVGDRVVWRAVLDTRLTRAHHGQPTVNYRTRHQAHYRHFAKEPPPDARRLNPAPLTPLLPVAAARQRVSLCMIVRDEEHNLGDCLRPVAGLVDEMVVVDTGSRDGTRDVARACGARVVDFPWQDSFAAARNESLRHATGEWVLWLDADDRIDEDNRGKLQRLFGLLAAGNRVYMMKQWSAPEREHGSALVVDHAQLFRRQPGVCWRYRVHEQILPALRDTGAKVVWTDVVIRHLGYRGAELRRHKLQRNLRLLQLEQAEQPDDAFTLFNLAGTYLDLGEFERVLPCLRRCLETAPAGATFVPKAYVMLAQTHRVVGRAADGLPFCREGLARFPGEVELWFEEGMLHHAVKDAAGAQRCFERVLELPARPCYVGVDSGLRGHLARHHLALAHRAQGRPREAEAQWRAAVRDSPRYGPAWLGLAEVCLDQGRAAEVAALVEQLEREPGGADTAAVLRARVALAQGDAAGARRVLAEAVARAPHALWLRLMLSEVLVREGKDPDEAERQLTAVLAIDPKQTAARERLQRLRQKRAETAP
jgi:glycosyltransferase involved in cell wall biosynthesis